MQLKEHCRKLKKFNMTFLFITLNKSRSPHRTFAKIHMLNISRFNVLGAFVFLVINLSFHFSLSCLS